LGCIKSDCHRGFPVKVLDREFPHGAKEGDGFSRIHKVPEGNLMPATKKESSQAKDPAGQSNLIIKKIFELA